MIENYLFIGMILGASLTLFISMVSHFNKKWQERKENPVLRTIIKNKPTFNKVASNLKVGEVGYSTHWSVTYNKNGELEDDKVRVSDIRKGTVSTEIERTKEGYIITYPKKNKCNKK